LRAQIDIIFLLPRYIV